MPREVFRRAFRHVRKYRRVMRFVGSGVGRGEFGRDGRAFVPVAVIHLPVAQPQIGDRAVIKHLGLAGVR